MRDAGYVSLATFNEERTRALRLQDTATGLEAELAALKLLHPHLDTVLELHRERDALKARAAEMSDLADRYDKSGRADRIRADAAEARVAQVEQEWVANQQAWRDLTARADDAEARARELEARYAALRATSDIVADQRDGLRKEAAALREELDLAFSVRDSVMDERDAAQKKAAVLRKELEASGALLRRLVERCLVTENEATIVIALQLRDIDAALATVVPVPDAEPTYADAVATFAEPQRHICDGDPCNFLHSEDRSTELMAVAERAWWDGWNADHGFAADFQRRRDLAALVVEPKHKRDDCADLPPHDSCSDGKRSTELTAVAERHYRAGWGAGFECANNLDHSEQPTCDESTADYLAALLSERNE